MCYIGCIPLIYKKTSKNECKNEDQHSDRKTGKWNEQIDHKKCKWPLNTWKDTQTLVIKNTN